MKPDLYIGIDPGKSGAIAFNPMEGEPWAVKLDGTDADIAGAMQDALYSAGVHNAFAALEKVHSSPQMGVKSAFTFGESFGKCQMLLAAYQIPFEIVRPQQWQKDLGCMTGGDKNVSKARAQQLFPTIKITHAIADALLLAEYARRISR